MIKKLLSIDTQASQRVFGLDVLRALAIIIVVDAHGSWAFRDFYRVPYFKNFLPDGVELFFVLSGFLIGGILIRLYEKSPDWSPAVIVNFWTRRWFRTLPNYYLVLCLLIGIFLVASKLATGNAGIPVPSELPRYFLFMQNLQEPTPPFFGESWSLAIEEWSYLVIPTALWVVHRLFDGRLSRQHILLILILGIILTVNLLRLYAALVIPEADGEKDVRVIVMLRLDAIAYGVLGAYVKAYYPNFWKNRRLTLTLFLIGLVLVSMASFSASLRMVTFYYTNGIEAHYIFFKHTYYYLIMGLSMTLLLPYMDGLKSGGNGWVTRAITHISLISYSMYLINLSLIMNYVIDAIPTTSLAVGWMKYLGFWALVLLVSTLLFKYFEKPMTDIRDRISRKEPKLVSKV